MISLGNLGGGGLLGLRGDGILEVLHERTLGLGCGRLFGVW